MKFLDIIKQYETGLVVEQDAPPPEQEIPQDPAAAEQQPATPEQPAEGESEMDVPASIATLGSLLKKALTMKISDEDRYKISQLPNINEKNATEIINQLQAIMKSYSVDIDIDNNDNTSI